MASERIQVNNPENWQLKTVITKTAEKLGDKAYVPIGEFDTGVSLTSPFFLAEINCSEKKTTWDYGGNLRPEYSVEGLSIYGRKYSLAIGKTLLIVVNNDVAIPYGLRYASPKWFKDLTLRIWEYIGLVEDTTITQLNNIQLKIDQLL